jgi:hypothetical protein
VYMDDISLSSNDSASIQQAFNDILSRLNEANFEASPTKVRPPSSTMDLFNCDLEFGRTEVQQARMDKFEAEDRSDEAKEAFANYCLSVEAGNIPIPT